MTDDVEIKITEYTLGGQLMRSRLKKDWEIARVSTKLKISSTYIKALEEGDLSHLPETAYVLGFIRSYADLLGIKSDEMIKEYKSISKHKKSINYYVPQTPEDGNKHFIYIIAGLILTISIIWISSNKLLDKSDNMIKDAVNKNQKINVIDGTAAVTSVDLSEVALDSSTAITTDFPTTVVTLKRMSENMQSSTAIQPVALKPLVLEKSQTAAEEAAEDIASKKALQLAQKEAEDIAKSNALKKANFDLRKSDNAVFYAKKYTYVNISSLSRGTLFNGFLEKGKFVSVPFNSSYKITAPEHKNLKVVLKKGNLKRVFNNIRVPLNTFSLSKDNLKALVGKRK